MFYLELVFWKLLLKLIVKNNFLYKKHLKMLLGEMDFACEIYF